MQTKPLSAKAVGGRQSSGGRSASLGARSLPALLLRIPQPHLRAWNLEGEGGSARTLTDQRATVAMRCRGREARSSAAALSLLGGAARGTALPQPRAVPRCREESCIAAQLQWTTCRVVVWPFAEESTWALVNAHVFVRILRGFSFIHTQGLLWKLCFFCCYFRPLCQK